MEFTSTNDIIDFAIKSEIEAAEFYENAAENEGTKGIVNMLKEYAQEERKHERMLKHLKDNQAKIESYLFEKVQNLKRSDYLVDMEYRPGMSYVDIVRVAMKREEKAYKLYTEMAQAAEKSEQKNVFSIMAQEEAKHKNYFETMYDDYMAQQGD
ncbi:MAG: ferritin family protein [Deltaproteobacteria bacterium]|jgi:rubrerythrin|nr:ferritin family protein [Deltaproteobacteria bacterium]MBT4527664.1 ferritin family protein [Deltaproteobacteria bacterium]